MAHALNRLQIADETLLTQVARGDHHALATLFQRHQRSARHLAFRTLHNQADAQDVAQDAFMRVWRAAPRFKPNARFTTWLYRIVINLCLDRKRAEKRHQTFLNRHTHAPGPPEPPPDPTAHLEQLEDARRVQQAITDLTPRQRAVVILHRFQGLSHAQIATRTGLSRSAVESLLSRAYRNLRPALASLFNEPDDQSPITDHRSPMTDDP